MLRWPEDIKGTFLLFSRNSEFVLKTLASFSQEAPTEKERIDSYLTNSNYVGADYFDLASIVHGSQVMNDYERSAKRGAKFLLK